MTENQQAPIATHVRDLSLGVMWDGRDDALYQMEPPYEGHEFVRANTWIDSTAGMRPSARNTVLRPADEDGASADEMLWSGHTLRHGEAFAAIGYRRVQVPGTGKPQHVTDEPS